MDLSVYARMEFDERGLANGAAARMKNTKRVLSVYGICASLNSTVSFGAATLDWKTSLIPLETKRLRRLSISSLSSKWSRSMSTKSVPCLDKNGARWMAVPGQHSGDTKYVNGTSADLRESRNQKQQ